MLDFSIPALHREPLLTRYDFCSAQKLKGDVAQMIRKNQILEKDLETLDVKIGLLVKNRITLQVNISVIAEKHLICDRSRTPLWRLYKIP